MDNNGFNYFENSRYIDNRIQRKTLILDHEIGGNTTFNIQLHEPISINKESDAHI